MSGLAIFGKIFGSGEVIKQGVELIDALHTSTEEEIAAKNKARVDLLNAYSGFKVAQRYLAVMFSVTFLLCFFLVLSCTLAGVGTPAEVLGVMETFWIGPIMLSIVGFYFGGGAFEGAMKAKKP